MTDKPAPRTTAEDPSTLVTPASPYHPDPDAPAGADKAIARDGSGTHQTEPYTDEYSPNARVEPAAQQLNPRTAMPIGTPSLPPAPLSREAYNTEDSDSLPDDIRTGEDARIATILEEKEALTDTVFVGEEPGGGTGGGGGGTPTIPTVRDTPVILGTPQVGQALNCTMGNWNGEPTSYAYRWFAGGEEISGVTGSIYTPVTADVGDTIEAELVATNAAGSSTPVRTDPTAAVIAATSATTAKK